MHGDKDDLVPVSQARLLEEEMQKKGGRHELVILPGQGHAFAGAAAKQAEAALWAFFEKHLKGK